MSTLNGQTALAYAKVWHHVSAKGIPLGRLASNIAITLMGKHKPIFHPAADCGDVVVVTDCENIRISGRKLEQHKYYSHSGRPGKLKEWTMEEMVKKRGYRELLRRAVGGMLPKNRLWDMRMNRLHIYDGPTHPYKANIFRRYNSPILSEIEMLKK
ncbi:ribosomal protein subunit L13 [Schizosaccharomyces octosporus yFS286]|uniref:Ribosomal protein subunit L13 n=1 Tax=Schizosaccharomyces octosporus (strain yFS286) TaxID=483514 RepID=S9RGQ0_SCHOY|nr:ribosomal protein subunit L13 [Schizosaccharomyces octosporus yFS286]EPX73229.1 ribosomal protein subunit L13 [Schizosaccharomyces octosporus yFS286]